VDGKPGTVAGIPAGSFVNIGLSVARQTIRNLQAEGPNLGGCGGSMVKVVDAVNNYVTFDDTAASDVAGKTFAVAADASVSIDGKPGKLADIPAGAYLNVTLTVDRQKVRSVGAQGPRTTGVVRAVDVATNTITIDDKNYTVAKDAAIVVEGRTASLSGLPTGATVSLNLNVDQKTVGMIQTKSP
jgi:hypothetical protein